MVWIEILRGLNDTQLGASPPTRVVWIEIGNEPMQIKEIPESPPTRVVWIEISTENEPLEILFPVTTHTGGVD